MQTQLENISYVYLCMLYVYSRNRQIRYCKVFYVFNVYRTEILIDLLILCDYLDIIDVFVLLLDYSVEMIDVMK